MRTSRLLLAVLLGVTGCGPDPTDDPTPSPRADTSPPAESAPAPAMPEPPRSPTPPAPVTPPPGPLSVEDATASVEAALEASHQVRSALELLGVLPSYTCGEPVRVFALRTSLALQRYGCASAALESGGPTAAGVVVRFAPGCQVQGRTVEGEARLSLRVGDAREELEVDLRGLSIDGEALRVRAGYGTCGDEQRVWAEAEGALPRRADVGYRVDMQVGVRSSSLPLIGGTTLILDGQAELHRGPGVDLVAFEALEYEVGGYLPKSGALEVKTADGHQVRARFSGIFWKLGKAEVSVDGGPEVAVPIVH